MRAGILDRVLRDYRSRRRALAGDARRAAARARARPRGWRELGWPSTRDEHWRYANLRAFERLRFVPAARQRAPPALDRADLPAAPCRALSG